MHFLCVFIMSFNIIYMYFPLVSLVTLIEVANKECKQRNDLDYDKLDQMYFIKIEICFIHNTILYANTAF